MLLFFLMLLFLSLCAFHVITRYSRKGLLFSRIDGPAPYPIIGNMLTFISAKSMDELWSVCRDIIKKYYPISRVYALHTAVVNIVHPDDLEILFTSQKAIQKGFGYWYLDLWLKTGLLTSTGDKWRQRRKLLTPAFHFSILKKYLDITSEQGEKFVEVLKNEGDETVKSLIPLCSNYTLNIICESTLGVALDKIDDKSIHEYHKAVHKMGTVVLYRLIRPYILNWMFPFVWKMNRMQSDALKVLHNFTNKVVKDRREYHANTGNKYLNESIDDVEDAVHNNFIGRRKRLAMLDLLLVGEKNGLIDDEGIKEEVDTFTFEGHDTSGMAMTFALMLLAENKEAQDRARVEVTEVLNRSNGKTGVTEIQELNYLERCIKESLRLYPPVATLMRYTSEELQLKNALVPSGTHIVIHVWDTHRDSNFWSEPDKFNPDRFLPENTKNRHPFAYIPFSAGPRNCIGQKFALMELKSLIARILYDFYLEPIDRTADMRIGADIILRPLDPVHLKFVRINK